MAHQPPTVSSNTFFSVPSIFAYLSLSKCTKSKCVIKIEKYTIKRLNESYFKTTYILYPILYPNKILLL